MNDSASLLEENLGNLRDGAKAFKVLAIVLTVIGCILVGAGGLKLLRLLKGVDWAIVSDALQTASGCLIYFLFAWLAHRASEAFESIVALINELGEIV
jgi:hypothetical protein